MRYPQLPLATRTRVVVASRKESRQFEAVKIGSVGVVAFILSLAGRGALAQCTPGGPASPSAVKRAIVGTMMDTSHQVLENVTVATRTEIVWCCVTVYLA